MDLARAAKLTGVRLADLRHLNSGLKRGQTLPAGPQRLPVSIGFGHRLRAKASHSQLPLPKTAQGGTDYRVREGDNLSSIASRYRVSIAALKRANGLNGDRVAVGRALVIPAEAVAPGERAPALPGAISAQSQTRKRSVELNA
jgi:membrane-bound lytic murein transglycosylase D